MKKLILSLITVSLFMSFLMVLSTSVFCQDPTEAATYTVPDDFSTIQAAIDFASPGDKVYVRSGTYHEHITINKELILAGEDRETAVVDGNGTGNVINVTASNITISGLKITNGFCGLYSSKLYQVLNLTIRDTIIDSNDYGIAAEDKKYYWLIEDCIFSNNLLRGLNLALVHRFVIQNNEIFGNGGGGVHLWFCSDWPVFENNSIHDNGAYGIYCQSLQGARIVKNHVFSNGGPGIWFVLWTHGNRVYDNIIYNNEYGIRLGDQRVNYNRFYHNDIIDNLIQAVDGLGLNFWDDGIPSRGNYWSDYAGDDLNDDGIGDTPYFFVNNQDNFPLMRPLWFYTEVFIDIKPGSYPNSINLGSNGNVPVAIFSSPDFDAATVEPETVTLAGAGVRIKGKGNSARFLEDVNGDGLLDLVVHIDTSALDLFESDTEAVLEGLTYDGRKFRGIDTVRIVK